MGIELTGVAGMLEAIDDIKDALIIRDKWVIGTNVPYASFQEFGTSYQTGTPHLRPGFDQTVAKFDAIAGDMDDGQEIVKEIALEIERETKLKAPVDTGHLRASYRTEKW